MGGITAPKRWPSHKKIDPWLAYMWGDQLPSVRPAGWPIGADRTLEILLSLATTVSQRKGWPVDPAARAEVHQDEIPKDTEFERQKEAFKSIPPIFLAPYRGQFVAACNGVIVDSDNDLGALGRRFFEKHGDVPVYMTKVGDTVMVRIPTPFLR